MNGFRPRFRAASGPSSDPSPLERPGAGILLIATAVVCALFGIYLGLGGAWLVWLGGSPYYIIAGVALIVIAWLLQTRRSAALSLYAALLLGTLIWALWEVRLDFWALAPRGDILAPLGVWLLLPFITRRLAPAGWPPFAALGVAVLASLGILAVSLMKDPHNLDGALAATTTGGSPGGPGAAAADWTAYGGTGYGDRFSALTEITPQNVGKLKLAWEFRTGDMKGPNDPGEYTNEATPLKIGDLLYTCSPHQIVFALDAATGKLAWKFDPAVQHNTSFQHLTCRGVSYHRTQADAKTAGGSPAPADCPERIFLPTNDGRMFALDAKSGQPCQGFGDHGQINLKEGSEVTTLGQYEGTSPPVVTDKVLIMGGAVIDNYAVKVPSGVIRGFDIYSGKLLWAFDAGNPDPNEMPSATHHFTAGSPNSWSVSAVDEKLGLVYLPLGSGSADIWGGRAQSGRRTLGFRACRAGHRDRQTALVVPERPPRSLGHGHALAALARRSADARGHGPRDLCARQDWQYLRPRPA
jgi:quinoprotein glucose dehydrogenase